ncbi:MAG: OmpH family outer membrane protein [Planctomycetota bacterium]|nr:OmpH family outer membrane protein [Planctomycetota bacterium]
MKQYAKMLVLGGAFMFAVTMILAVPVWTQSSVPGTLKVAVVNVRDVFSQYKAAIEFENSVEVEKTKMQSEIDKIEGEMKNIIAEVEQLDKEGPVWHQRSMQLVRLDAERKFLKDEWQAKVTARLNRNTAAMYNKIREEIDKYAVEAGFDLVFKIESKKLEQESTESANARINRRNVLTWRDSLDITSVIVERLNKQ